ncbi:MAG: polysaccharide biosynthesis tyrosine autokinase [Planctomycetota bacterium]|nr:polysaccharide biosynthesis tyrosine autokinase [Planctomycetota bacterium]
MSRHQPGSGETERSAPRSIFQYIDILRDRWLSALVAFLVVAGLVALHALFSSPQYSSQALLQIEMGSAPNDALAALTLASSQSDIDAELRVMASYRVAERAAVLAGLGVTISEENAYRPWDSFLRGLTGEGAPPRLTARIVSQPRLTEGLHVRLVFDRRGNSFRLEDAIGGRDLGTYEYDRRDGAELELAGVTLLLTSPLGRPRNATYTLKLPAGEAAALEVAGVVNASKVDAATEKITPVPLHVATAIRAMPRARADVAVRFSSDGKQFEFTVDGEPQQHSWDPAVGAEFAIAGEQIHLGWVEGDPAGRTFHLRLHRAQDAASLLQSSVVAAQVGRYTGVVNIGAVADDPYFAQRAAEALAASYLELKQRRKDDQIISRLAWLRNKLAEEQEALTAALNVRDTFMGDGDAVLLGEKAAAAFEAQSALFEQELIQQDLLERAKATLAGLRSTQSSGQALAVIGQSKVDVQTQAIADRLVQLQIERGTMLRQRSTEADLPVKALDAEIAELEGILEKRVKALLAEVDADILRNIDVSKTQLQRIATEHERHEKTLKALPTMERALAEKTRDVVAAQQRYVFLEQMKSEAEIALTSTMSQVTLVDQALLDTARKSPVLFRQAIVAFFLGLFAAVGVALLRHLRERSVQSPTDIENRLGLTLLATIPDFSTVPRRQRKGLKGSLVVHELPSSPLTENYRTLRANIRFADGPRPIQALTLTSAVPSEGKTVTTLNLALAMAGAGNSVIVVDADLRRPMVAKHLKGERAPGLSDTLLGTTAWRDAVQKFKDTGLSFLSAGAPHANPIALLEGGQFEELLAELREEFDYILFDVPPVLAVADAAGFFSSLDAVLLVSRHGACPIDIVESAKAQVVRFGGNLIGAVYNGFDAKRAASRRYGYGSYYGYYGYYGYGKYYGKHGDYGDESGSQEDGSPPAPQAS